MKRFFPVLLLALALAPSAAQAQTPSCADTLVGLRVQHQVAQADAAFDCLSPDFRTLLGVSSADALAATVDTATPASTPNLAATIDAGDGITLSVYLDHGDRGPFAWYVWTDADGKVFRME